VVEPDRCGRIAGKLADDRYHAVCVGPDVPESLALDVEPFALDLLHPEVGVVLVREATPLSGRRRLEPGVREIVPPGDVRGSDLLDALARCRSDGARNCGPPSGGTDGPRSRVIVVLSPKGGSGKTMLTTNLGDRAGGEPGGPDRVVDLDCVFGDVASALGLVPEHTIGELAGPRRSTAPR
jgi:pilus assembly protein CpaE